MLTAAGLVIYLAIGVLLARYMARRLKSWVGTEDALAITLLWPLIVTVHIWDSFFCAVATGGDAIGRLILRGVKK